MGIEPMGIELRGLSFITPNWPAPDNIHAFSSTRNLAGEAASAGKYDGFNLALHVEDATDQVLQNRQQLSESLNLPREPLWLNQVHGHQVVNCAQTYIEPPKADASFSEHKNYVCTVMTADCLPVLICNRQGTKVAAVHAGWRGLADGIIEKTIQTLNEKPENILVWLGPAIGADAFEVGEEVRNIFIQHLSDTDSAFKQNRPGHYLADIYRLAKTRLRAIHVEAVYGGEHCTFNDADQFYSYRRDGVTGRQASIIWFA